MLDAKCGDPKNLKKPRGFPHHCYDLLRCSGSRHMLESFAEKEPEYQKLEDEVEFLMVYLDDMRQLIKIYTKEVLEDPNQFLDKKKTEFLKKVWIREFIDDRSSCAQGQLKKKSSAKKQKDERYSEPRGGWSLTDWSWLKQHLNSAYFYEAVSVYPQLHGLLSK